MKFQNFQKKKNNFQDLSQNSINVKKPNNVTFLKLDANRQQENLELA